MKIVGIDHVGIAVSNLDDALRFYVERCGLSADPIEERPDLGLRIARVWVGDVQLELIEARDWERTTQRYLPHRGPGVYHVGLRVADVDAAVAELGHADVTLIDRVPRAGADMRVAFVHPDATSGGLIELVTREENTSGRPR